MVRVEEETEQLRAGHLLRRNPSSHAGGILSETWEHKFCVIVGNSLQIYKYPTEKHAHRPTRVVPLSGCNIRAEPEHGSNTVYSFSIVDGSGHVLVELGATSPKSADLWMASLAKTAGGSVSVWEGDSAVVGGFYANASDGTLRRRKTSWWNAPKLALRLTNLAQREGDESSSRRRKEGTTRGGGAPAVEDKADAKLASFDMSASARVHRRAIYSILSSERLSYQRHDGLVNLGTVIIIATNFRLILENLLKYGLRVHPLAWLIPNVYKTTSPEAVARTRVLLLAWPALFMTCVVAFLLELAARRLSALHAGRGQAAGNGVAGAILYACMAINVAASLALPSYLIHATVAEPLAGFVLIMLSVVIFLKLWSYVHANSDLRARWQARVAMRVQQVQRQQQHSASQHPTSSENSENFAISESEIDDDAVRGSADGDVSSGDERMSYPENLIVENYAYFLFAPTLCYQMSYPRNPSIRFTWLMRRVVEMFVYLSIMTFLIEVRPRAHALHVLHCRGKLFRPYVRSLTDVGFCAPKNHERSRIVSNILCLQ